MDNKYPWSFCSLGGVTRVKISSGEDIAHLGELDQKLWTVLSCPVDGLHFDKKTLTLMDTDKDGKIRVYEVVAAAQWITSVLKDKDLLLKGSDTLALSELNQGVEAGARLYNSAKQILANLGKADAEEITLADSSDSVAIFAGTKFNGDGIVTPESTEDEAVKEAIAQTIALVGSKTDRSGVAGVDADLITAFYDALAAYVAWAEAKKADILPFGDETEAALAAVEAVKAKIADYFLRCKLIAFNADAAGAVDVDVAKIAAISAGDMTAEMAQIAEYPLARPSADGVLAFDGINPAWKAAFANLKALVLDKELKGKKGMTEDQWNAIVAKFDAFKAWAGAKAGASVESLGLEKAKELLKADKKADVLALIEQDLALTDEANAIDEVDKLMHLYRYFFEFLNNYVILGAFYSPTELAVFQAGKLYIDQRCLDLCINVADMGKHADMAGQSGMYILYCNCVSKSTGKTALIAAVLTDGDVDSLRVGQNAVFYDRDGLDYDATITKIVDNPVSIRQAFWSPYKKLARAISDRIAKSAAEKDAKATGDLTAKANTTNIPTTQAEADAAKAKAPAENKFDIAKFAGIFAAIGLALGFVLSALAALFSHWYTPLIAILVLIIVISGPSMFIAWLKLRKRNLGPVLNANGWAINSKIIVNIVFGATLTSLAKYPKVATKDDPYAPKKSPWPTIIIILLLLCGAGAALYFTNNLKWMGIERKPKVEQVEAPAEAPAEAEVAPEAAPEAE
ncbi:MAG: hypothetical protein J5740_05670 [Bacteroidales bacterium]|nr:hypothetical protein [Bacteroidales bacterium]